MTREPLRKAPASALSVPAVRAASRLPAGSARCSSHAALREHLGLLDQTLPDYYKLPEDLALARIQDSLETET